MYIVDVSRTVDVYVVTGTLWRSPVDVVEVFVEMRVELMEETLVRLVGMREKLTEDVVGPEKDATELAAEMLELTEEEGTGPADKITELPDESS